MKGVTFIFIAFAIAFVGTGAAPAQSANGKIVEQIMKLEAEYTESGKKGPNLADLDRYYTDDYMLTARIPPRTETKSEIYARIKDPNFRPGTIESLTEGGIKVRVYGDDTAIVTGSWKRTSRDANGKDTSASGRFTRVWVKQNGKWLLAAAHYSPDIDLEKLRLANRNSR